MLRPDPNHECPDPLYGGCCEVCQCDECTSQEKARRDADECVKMGHKPDSCRESDDDGDDDEPADGESFDGGFGPGSYFDHVMRKDD